MCAVFGRYPSSKTSAMHILSHSLAVLFLLFVWACSALGDETVESLQTKAKAALAKVEGEMVVPGLQAPVEVLRDTWGVPHIYAGNQHDLFFAQGFVAAQDRLFQIDLWRRTALGQTAAVLGARTIEADRFAR